MRIASMICKWAGKVWLWLATVFILFGYAAIWYFDGWGELQTILSPFNIWNIAAVVITLVPGFGLLKLGDYLSKR